MLLRGRITLRFSLELYYRLTDLPASDTMFGLIGYEYSFTDTAGREIVAYHWHPDIPSAGYPHIHIGHGAVQAAILERAGLSPAHNALLPELAGAHLPTGEVALGSVLRMAIEQFGVEPRRRDWASILG
jgi:hypothetical protein